MGKSESYDSRAEAKAVTSTAMNFSFAGKAMRQIFSLRFDPSLFVEALNLHNVSQAYDDDEDEHGTEVLVLGEVETKNDNGQRL